MATLHLNAEPGDFAETVLMPGDPLRAKYIAETFLDDHRQVTDVRNMWGYTGRYKGREVSVMPHGMGIPSASIYCLELLQHFGVRRLLRVGSCGSVLPEVKLRDIVIGMGASTDSAVNRQRFGGYDYAAIASYSLVEHAVSVARSKGLSFHVGNLFSADLFYASDPTIFERLVKYRIIGVEMEAAGIYAVAAEFGAEALTICTVSDDVLGDVHLSTVERQNGFNEMIELALESVLLSA